MKRTSQIIGRVAFWVGWPILWAYLFRSKRVRLLIVCGEEVLVVKPTVGTGQWSLPGGGLHPKEVPVDGLAREIKEELGIELQQDKLQELGEAKAHQHGLSFHYYSFVYQTKVKPEITLQTREISEIWWVGLSSVDSIRSDRLLKDVLNRWRGQL